MGLGLNFAGSLVVALWRDGQHGHGVLGTFGELFILAPQFWTRAIESKR